jgi:hypothetical protein
MAANNAPFTNQGRADLRRSPTEAQIAFNNNRSSQISVLNADLCVLNEARTELTNALFEPTIVGITPDTLQRLSVFVWMTDRVTACWATQRYPETVEIDGNELGFNLCTCATVVPTNGLQIDVVGVTCTLLSVDEIGAQATLAYGTGATALSVRGTPLLVGMNENDYLTTDDTPTAAPAEVNLRAYSESLLSGKPEVLFTAPFAGTTNYNAYGAPVIFRRQIILRLSDYIAGQYWLTSNVYTSGAESADIVGVFTAPVPATP